MENNKKTESSESDDKFIPSEGKSGLIQFKCPSCGGALSFDVKSQKVKCPYCDQEFEAETLKELDEQLSDISKEDKMLWDKPGRIWQEADASGMRSYVCKSCGGEIIGDKNLGATTCPYCGNPVVMSGQFAGDLKPDYIIPFKVDRKQAINALYNYYNDAPFLPKTFKDKNHINEIKAVYVPFWLYDVDITGSAAYDAQIIRNWSDSHFMYTEINHYSLIREVRMAFEKIPEDGSSSMPDDLMDALDPYHFTEAREFQTAYMAGYMADRYDVDINETSKKASESIKKSLEEELRKTTVGFSSVRIKDQRRKLDSSNVSYALYPVYILNTVWNDEKYTFAVNGETGKIAGDLPIDSKKVVLQALLIFLGCFVGVFLYLFICSCF